MKKSRKIFAEVIAFIVCLSGASVAHGQDRIDYPNFLRKFSFSTNPVDIKIGATHLKIPRNYLLSAIVTKSIGRANLTLFVHFPSFLGATHETIACLRAARPICADRIIVYRRNPTSYRWYNKMLEALRTGERKYERIYGLYKFDGVASGWLRGRYYIYPGSTRKKGVAIRCTLPGAPLQYCRVRTDLTSDMGLMYQFSPERLPDWRMLHKGIKDLFNGFVMRE
jgi:hypothetical protein